MIVTYSLMFVVTLLLMLILIHAAPRLGLIAAPSGHRQHEAPTPLVGGIAIFIGFCFGILAADVPLSAFRPLFLGCGLLVLVGVLDDARELSSRSRFAAQIGAALIMIYFGGVVLYTLGNLSGSGAVLLGVFAVPLTVFATVGVINSMNMVDGMDGLAGGLFLVAFGALLWVSGESGVRADQPILVMIMLGVTCFMLFNARLGLRRRAAVFLGDAGSMFLGFVLCWYLVRYSQPPFRIIDPVTALWLMAVPLIDTVSVMLRRMLYRHSPFEADRTHLHHLLLHAGLPVGAVLALMLTVGASAAGFGIAIQALDWPEPVGFVSFLSLFLLHFVATGWYAHTHRLTAAG